MALRGRAVHALLPFSVQAYNYSGGPILGEGSFQTVSYGSFPGEPVITSLTGEMNGQPMVFISGTFIGGRK
jgi:hypothetical protein